MRRAVILGGGECATRLLCQRKGFSTTAGTGTIIATVSAATTGASMRILAAFISTAAFQWPAVGTSLRQHPWDAGISIAPQSPFICSQQARSAGLKWTFGSAQAIAGDSSGNSTASINARWRTVFIPTSTLHRRSQEYKPRIQQRNTDPTVCTTKHRAANDTSALKLGDLADRM